MCLLFLVWQRHPAYRLILLANRDEFYQRPSSPASFWPHSPGLLAGRDDERGGTWLGYRRGGRWAALTNYRDPSAPQAPTSRGELVTRYLEGNSTPLDYAAAVAGTGRLYSGFNIIVGDEHSACYFSNRGGPPRELQAGVYGLSNHLLDTPWPKLTRGKAELLRVLRGPVAVDALFNVLGDRTIAPDEQLPDTGVGREWERILSPSFITSSEYGTRSSTVLLLSRQNETVLVERSFLPNVGGEYTPESYNEVGCQLLPEATSRHIVD